MIYVMADLHGCYDKFIQMLDKISFSPSDKLYIVGDVIDRGNKPIDILLYIMKQPNIDLILGNHEDMMLQWLNGVKPTLWFLNGGQSTYLQFNEQPLEVQKEIANYLNSRGNLYRIVDKFILVHAGFRGLTLQDRYSLSEILSMQSRDDCLWTREEFYNNPGIKGYVIIFGHTPVIYIQHSRHEPLQFRVWHDKVYKDKICIDCGAVFEKGRLACLRLDDMKEFYV